MLERSECYAPAASLLNLLSAGRPACSEFARFDECGQETVFTKNLHTENINEKVNFCNFSNFAFVFN